MRTGLRTEIILSISLLLAAALLFAGFLMVKLTESNLLEQQRAHAAAVLKLLAAVIDQPSRRTYSGQIPAITDDSLTRLQTVMARQPDIIAWRLLDNKLQILSSTVYQPTDEFPMISPSALEQGELVESLVYQSFSLFRSSEAQLYLELSTSLWAKDEAYGLLQVRFSLAALQQRVLGSQRLILIYVIVYGMILAAFGVYLLNRNVVKPVRQLHQATATVAAGTLTSVIVPSGPGEIHDLAESFNRMVSALGASRAESEEHIASLEEANQALARARDDLVRSEKLATVGHLAAGMAHEIGNPLGAVIGYLNILKEDLRGEPGDLAERCLAETARIDRLIRELLDYSAPVARQNELFCPVALLRESITMLRHQGQLDGIRIDDNAVSDKGLVNMDRGRLMQVWINILLNARDAMRGQGTIRISSQRQEQTLSVSILDAGGGLEPHVARRIFEPFFTTKAPGSGYGLGLAVCQRIIDENDGRIEVSSEAGQGACFTVVLPAHPQDQDKN